MNKIGKILCLLLLCMSATAYSQHHRDIANLSYWNIPVTYKDTSTSVNMIDFNMDIPLYKKDKNSLFGSVELRSASISNFPDVNTTNLYSTSFRLAYLHKVNATLSLALFGQVGLFSDFKDISSEDIRTTVGFQYRIKHSEKLKTGLGIAYATQFFGHQLLPYISIDYHPTANWYIYGQIPTNVKIERLLSEKDFVGFGVRGLTNSYRLSKNTYNSQFIQTVEWMGKFYWEHFLTKNLSFNINAGHTFSQSFRLYDNIEGDMLNSWTILTIPVGKKRPDPVREISKNSFVYQLGISYSLF